MSTRGVIVHGVEIPESLLALEAQNHPGLSAAEARTAAGDALATKALLLHRACELGLDPRPDVDESGRQETPEAALVRAVLDAEIGVTSPTETECRHVYDTHRARFRSAPLYEAAHILLEPRSPSAEDDAAARAAAAALIGVLAVHPERFAELAALHSACPSRAVGGSLGQCTVGDLVAGVEQALMQLNAGQIAPAPVRSRFGWHVLKLERRHEGRDIPFEHVASHIRQTLEARALQAAAARYVLKLAEDAKARCGTIALDDTGRLAGGSACLGDYLGDGMDADRLLSWLDDVDADLAGRVRSAAAADGVGAHSFVRSAAATFIRIADDEQWTQLLSAARKSTDAALGTLAAMLQLTLRAARPAVTVFPRRTQANPCAD